jgi:hypothetical protein
METRMALGSVNPTTGALIRGIPEATVFVA